MPTLQSAEHLQRSDHGFSHSHAFEYLVLNPAGNPQWSHHYGRPDQVGTHIRHLAHDLDRLGDFLKSALDELLERARDAMGQRPETQTRAATGAR